MMELDCKALMGNLIKSLPAIQQNCINLLPSVQSNCEVMYSGDELTGSLFPEAMLVIAQNLVVHQTLHRITDCVLCVP